MSSNTALLSALRMNAIFSALSAVLMLVFGRWVAAQLGLADATLVYVTGGLLLLFALQLANIVRTQKIRRWEVLVIIGGDLGWVLGTVVLLALYYSSVTTIGFVLADGVALAVLYFAIQQIRGLQDAVRAQA